MRMLNVSSKGDENGPGIAGPALDMNSKLMELENVIHTARCGGQVPKRNKVSPSTKRARTRKSMQRSASAPSISHSQQIDPFSEGNPIQRVEAKLGYYRGDPNARSELFSRIRAVRRKQRVEMLSRGGNKVEINKKHAKYESRDRKLWRISKFNNKQAEHAKQFYRNRRMIQERQEQKQLLNRLMLELGAAATEGEKKRLHLAIKQQQQLVSQPLTYRKLSHNNHISEEVPAHSAPPEPKWIPSGTISPSLRSRRRSCRFAPTCADDAVGIIQRWWRHQALVPAAQERVLARQIRKREQCLIRKKDSEHREKMRRAKANAKEDALFHTSMAKLPTQTVQALSQNLLADKRKGHKHKLRGHYRLLDGYYKEHVVPKDNLIRARTILGVRQKETTGKTPKKKLPPPPVAPVFKLLIDKKMLDQVLDDAMREMVLASANIQTPTSPSRPSLWNKRTEACPTPNVARQNSAF